MFLQDYGVLENMLIYLLNPPPGTYFEDETASKEIKDKDIVDLIGQILEGPYSTLLIQQYALITLLKYATRVPSTKCMQ